MANAIYRYRRISRKTNYNSSYRIPHFLLWKSSASSSPLILLPLPPLIHHLYLEQLRETEREDYELFYLSRISKERDGGGEEHPRKGELEASELGLLKSAFAEA